MPLRPNLSAVSRRQRRLDRREVGAPGVEHALAVDDGEVLDAGLEQDPGHGDAGGAGAGDHHAGALGGAAGEAQGVLERGQRDHGGAVLVVVEDRDVELLLEPLLDLEAARRGDVLEVDAAEARREPRDGLDDLLDVGGVQADRDGVDAAELLEQDGLALHHRHRRGRADVAEAEHGRAVGDDGDGVGHPGVVLGHRRVRGDRLADAGDAGRVGQRELVPTGELDRRDGLHLAADVQVEDRVTGEGVRLAVPCGDPSTATQRQRGRPTAPGFAHGRGERPQPQPVRRRSTTSLGHGPAMPGVDALVGVVAQQPPAGLAGRSCSRSPRASPPACRRRSGPATTSAGGRHGGVPHEQPVAVAQRRLHRSAAHDRHAVAADRSGPTAPARPAFRTSSRGVVSQRT